MKKKERKYKKPNFLFYHFARFCAKIFLKFKLKLKVVRNDLKKHKGGCVIISNHESQIDFLPMAVSNKKRLIFVISNSFYQSIKVRRLLDWIRVIPKQQFQTTVSDMKKMKKVIDSDQKLVLYPSGLMSENGLPTPVPESTAKFLKWLNTDIFISKISGTYLALPKWGKGIRKGNVEIDTYLLMTKEQLKETSEEELDKLISKHLDFNSYATQEEKMVKYKNGNCIEGLENVLYRCPKCKTEFSMKNISFDTMKCNHCGNEVYMDEYSFLKPKTEEDVCYKYPSDWYNEIYNDLEKEINNNIDFEYKMNVIIKMLNYKKQRYEEVGFGILSLNKDNISINGTINGEDKIIVLKTKLFPILPFKPGKQIELQDGDNIYRCVFESGQEVMKWIMTIKILHNRHKNKKA